MQRIILLCVLCISMDSISACNICACTSMGSNLGILPKFRSHFIGVRQTYRSFSSVHPVSILNPEGGESRETYYNSELWGRWSPLKRLQIFGFLPFNTFQRTEQGKQTQIQGLGDASLLATYIVLNTGDSAGKGLRHALLAGAGAKLSTGKYDPAQFAGFQLGSGANDALVNLSYTLRYKSVGIMGEGNYQVCGTNSSQYRYGNKASVSGRVFSMSTFRKTTFLPYAGLQSELSGTDRLNGRVQDYTGGKATYASLGADLYKGRFQLGASAHLPLRQTLGDGQITAYPRLQMMLVYHFRSKTNCE